MKYLRPPKGEFNERTLQKTSSLGYKTVMWSFAYCDWDEKKQPSQEEAIKIITKNFHSGEIMLLHSNSKTNSEVLDKIIKEAKNQGYEFKSLDEFKNWIWNDLIYENTQKIKKSMRGKSSWKKEKLVKS